jgi:hypothetical protein
MKFRSTKGRDDVTPAMVLAARFDRIDGMRIQRTEFMTKTRIALGSLLLIGTSSPIKSPPLTIP